MDKTKMKIKVDFDGLGTNKGYTDYNNQRYHESIDNLTPADVYYGKSEEVLTKREQIKQATLDRRRKLNLRAPVPLYNSS